MQRIIGVRFKKAGRIYYFNPLEFDPKEGDGVIVETSRGMEYGMVVQPAHDVEDSQITQPLKPVIRLSTPEDLDNMARNMAKREEAIKIAQEKIEKHGLDMSVVDVEWTFDGSKVIFYFASDGRIDFRELVKDLASVFRIRIELRQIGIRDECKMLGGIAPCGRVCCCSNHLDEFERVSIKMAKNQGLSLNPAKISGLCGRLMCCLKYENEHYSETNKLMPKLDSTVVTPDGEAVVLACNPLRKIVTVRLLAKENFERKDYPLSDIKARVTIAQQIESEKDESDE